MKTEYPSPYIHEVYQSDLIDSAIDQFGWVNLFWDKNINQQVILLKRTTLNIFHNFISNKITLCDDKYPPWMNDMITHLIKKKKAIFQKRSVKHSQPCHFRRYYTRVIKCFPEAKYHE